MQLLHQYRVCSVLLAATTEGGSVMPDGGKVEKKLDWHHRKPRSLGGNNGDRNMSQVNAVQHQAWHILFRNRDPFEIAAIINAVWLDPDFKFEVKRAD